MRMKTIYAILAAALLCSCQKDIGPGGAGKPDSPTAYLQFRFHHKAGDAALRLNTNYTNGFDEEFTISKFKYYVSNVVLEDGMTEIAIPNAYFLVDESVASSKTIRIAVKPGRYSNLQVLLGVDSARNVSGAQTGALDPINDMFWTWNTGYIMMKLEGSSPLSKAPNNRLQYHIGGFSGQHSALRPIDVAFFTPLALMANQTLTIDITADLLRWFDGVNNLPIAEHAVSMTPGALSSQYADNVAAMFSVDNAVVQ